MEASELRIGNIVHGTHNGFAKDIVVYEFDRQLIQHTDDKQYTLPITQFSPIRITEEWLLKLGFKSVGITGNVFEICFNSVDRFVIESDGTLFYPAINYELCCFSEFKYIHQLQNLYFAVTGEELTLETEEQK